MTLQLLLPNNQTSFEPGEGVTVIAEWTVEPGVHVIELRLVWHTSGKGTTDFAVVQTWRFDNPTFRDTRSIDVSLPSSPYSFSGKLISLSWAFELIAQPSGDSTRVDFVLAPGRQEVKLH